MLVTALVFLLGVASSLAEQSCGLETCTQSSSGCIETDVVIIGAGFSGLAQLHQLRSAGIKVEVLEKAADIGGTWYHNRYPGARVDVRGQDYNLMAELLDNWPGFSEEFPSQADLLLYFQDLDQVQHSFIARFTH